MSCKQTSKYFVVKSKFLNFKPIDHNDDITLLYIILEFYEHNIQSCPVFGIFLLIENYKWNARTFTIKTKIVDHFHNLLNFEKRLLFKELDMCLL